MTLFCKVRSYANFKLLTLLPYVHACACTFIIIVSSETETNTRRCVIHMNSTYVLESQLVCESALCLNLKSCDYILL